MNVHVRHVSCSPIHNRLPTKEHVGCFSTFGIQIIGSITSLARRFPKFQIWVGKQMSNREYMYVANIVQLLLVHYFDVRVSSVPVPFALTR